jgi:flavin reductase (DIM6/NTAB) family NADH-FMN oxidoreductase RutF
MAASEENQCIFSMRKINEANRDQPKRIYGGPVRVPALKETAAGKAYRLMEAGPIVLVTTTDGVRPNIMTMGFHMVVQHQPPLIGCVIGPWDHSFTALRETGECVISIPGADLGPKVVDIGNCSGVDTDKFTRFRLTALPSRSVRPPSIAECLANIECTVEDDTLVDRYSLFVLRAKTITVNESRKDRRTLHHNGDGTFSVDGRMVDLRNRMVLWKQYQVDM